MSEDKSFVLDRRHKNLSFINIGSDFSQLYYSNSDSLHQDILSFKIEIGFSDFHLKMFGGVQYNVTCAVT